MLWPWQRWLAKRCCSQVDQRCYSSNLASLKTGMERPQWQPPQNPQQLHITLQTRHSNTQILRKPCSHLHLGYSSLSSGASGSANNQDSAKNWGFSKKLHFYTRNRLHSLKQSSSTFISTTSRYQHNLELPTLLPYGPLNLHAFKQCYIPYLPGLYLARRVVDQEKRPHQIQEFFLPPFSQEGDSITSSPPHFGTRGWASLPTGGAPSRYPKTAMLGSATRTTLPT